MLFWASSSLTLPRLAFGAGAVVAPDVEDDRVVAEAELLQPVHQLADLGVGVLDEPGEDLHQPPLERPFRSGMLSQEAIDRRRGVSFVSGGNPAEFLLPLEDALAVLVPAVVELALVLVGPLLEDVVRAVGGARGPVHEERLVGRERLVPLQPGEGLVGHVLGEVILLAVRRLDRVGVLVEPGLPLRGFAGEEAVEVVEPVAGRPAVERPHRGGLVGRGVVPFAERRRLVAVVVQHLGDGGGGLRDDAGVAVEVGGPLGDGAVADAVVVAAGQAAPRGSASKSRWCGRRCS